MHIHILKNLHIHILSTYTVETCTYTYGGNSVYGGRIGVSHHWNLMKLAHTHIINIHPSSTYTSSYTNTTSIDTIPATYWHIHNENLRTFRICTCVKVPHIPAHTPVKLYVHIEFVPVSKCHIYLHIHRWNFHVHPSSTYTSTYTDTTSTYTLLLSAPPINTSTLRIFAH